MMQLREILALLAYVCVCVCERECVCVCVCRFYLRSQHTIIQLHTPSIRLYIFLQKSP